MATCVRIGCSGFPFARARYFALFPAVEVQATFYDPPSSATLARWRAEAPPGFLFALKAWQVITHPAESPTYRRLRRPPAEPPATWGHFQETPAVRGAWERTRQAAQALDARVVLFQCPPSFRPSARHVDRLRRFFGPLERGGLCLAWEPRGPWPRELVLSLCAELDLLWALDPLAQPQPSPWPERACYFRLHGGPGYRHAYTDEELGELLRLCRDHPATSLYVFFNNRAMAQDAARFLSLR